MMDLLLPKHGLTFKVCTYADNLLIIVEGQTHADLERHGWEVIWTACEWDRDVGVNVVINKSVTMLLKGRLSFGRFPSNSWQFL